MTGSLEMVDKRPAFASNAASITPWRGCGELYRFELVSEGEGSLLVFTHVFDERLGPAAQHAAGWEAYLNRLDAHLAGGFLSEAAAHDMVPELHDRYVERFDPR